MNNVLVLAGSYNIMLVFTLCLCMAHNIYIIHTLLSSSIRTYECMVLVLQLTYLCMLIINNAIVYTSKSSNYCIIKTHETYYDEISATAPVTSKKEMLCDNTSSDNMILRRHLLIACHMSPSLSLSLLFTIIHYN